MKKITRIAGPAAPLLRANIDTDTIIRIEPLTRAPRNDLGRYALEALRLRPDGSEDPECSLNDERYRHAPILLAGANFGCGSSREGAVWALLGRGIECVLAEGFGDIFYNNCFQNGLLPVRLSAAVLSELAHRSLAGEDVCVDLAERRIQAGTACWTFEIEPARRDALLNGADEITQTQALAGEIARWEEADRRMRPWIWTVNDEAA